MIAGSSPVLDCVFLTFVISWYFFGPGGSICSKSYRLNIACFEVSLDQFMTIFYCVKTQVFLSVELSVFGLK